MSAVKIFTEIDEPKISDLGGKGYSLAVLIKNGFNVPKGFVISSEVFFKFLMFNNLKERIEKLTVEIDENNFQEKSKELKNLVLSGKIPEKVTSEIKENLNKLDVHHVSIRSSAVSEDSLKASFAGLHDTFLNVKAEPNLVLKNIKKCWASLYNDRAVIYRIKKGIPHLDGMAVIIQEMIPAEVSGIVFTVHPTNKKSLLVEASYGLGDIIVSGKIQPDYFVVDRETLEISRKRIKNKSSMSICSGNKIEIINVKKEYVEKQVISGEDINKIARTCLEIEKNFKYPQDIEWSVYNNKIYILQSRAITGGTK